MTLFAFYTFLSVKSVFGQIVSGPIRIYTPLIDSMFQYVVKPFASNDQALRDSILHLPGISAYWPLTSSYKHGLNLIDTTANATYVHNIPQSEPFPGGNEAVSFQHIQDDVLFNFAKFNGAFGFPKGWMMFWVKTSSNLYNNGKGATSSLFTASDSYFSSTKEDQVEFGRHVMYFNNPPNNHAFEFSKYDRTPWDFLIWDWNTESNLIKMFYNGQKVYSGPFGSTFTEFTSVIIGHINGWNGAVAHFAFGNMNLPDNKVENIWQIIYPSNKSIFACGDSKAANENDRWIPLLASKITEHEGEMWREAPYRIGLPGALTNQIYTYIVGQIDTAHYNPSIIIVSGGANDLSQLVTGALDSAGWVNRMYPVLDTLHGRWPNAEIFWIKPYRDDFSDGRYNAHALNMARWIDFVVSRPAYSSFSHAGINENDWFKPNISTYSDDRVHYNNAGALAAVQQWIPILTPFF